MKNRTLYELCQTPEGDHFVRAIGGRDREARERYRAWLAERGDERAEMFSIEDALLRDDYPERAAAIARAQAILAKSSFVREWWDMLTTSTPIRNCGSARAVRPLVRFAFECPRTWESLEPTADSSARHCETCAKLVYLCRSRDEAEERARRGECITLAAKEWIGVSREMTRGWTGRPDPVAIWADRVFPGERSDE